VAVRLGQAAPPGPPGHDLGRLPGDGRVRGVTGIALGSSCLLHGATFLTPKTTGDLRERAGWLARVFAPATGLIVVIWISWTHAIAGHRALLNPVELATWIAAIAAVWLVLSRAEGRAFAATTVTMAVSVLVIFVDLPGLYPSVTGRRPGAITPLE
jgi:cytochrome bd-type quinol oxidase subunit 2